MARITEQHMIDAILHHEDILEVTIGPDGQVWVNLNGVCHFRAYSAGAADGKRARIVLEDKRAQR